MDGEKQDNPEILVNPNKDNLLDDAQRSTTEEVVREGNNSKTIQHLLSDWRTAILSKPKIKQPGVQGEDRRRTFPKINQEHLIPKVRFSYLKIIIIVNKYYIFRRVLNNL